MRTAGMLGRFFRMDPLTVVKSNYFDFALRVAAWRYVSDKEAAEAEMARAAQASKGR